MFFLPAILLPLPSVLLSLDAPEMEVLRVHAKTVGRGDGVGAARSLELLRRPRLS